MLVCSWMHPSLHQPRVNWTNWMPVPYALNKAKIQKKTPWLSHCKTSRLEGLDFAAILLVPLTRTYPWHQTGYTNAGNESFVFVSRCLQQTVSASKTRTPNKELGRPSAWKLEEAVKGKCVPANQCFAVPRSTIGNKFLRTSGLSPHPKIALLRMKPCKRSFIWMPKPLPPFWRSFWTALDFLHLASEPTTGSLASFSLTKLHGGKVANASEGVFDLLMWPDRPSCTSFRSLHAAIWKTTH